MTALEDKLRLYTKPSSDYEQDRQDRAERMVRQSVASWLANRSDLSSADIRYVVKGSYANNTNVRQDCDVDIAVLRTDFHYFDASDLRLEDRHSGSGVDYPLEGIAFRNNLATSLKSQFGANCDTTGKTAIELLENSGRVSADVVPSFMYRKYYYDALGSISYHEGQKVFRTDGTSIVNYPDQQLLNGRTKNVETSTRYKQLVRIFKRAENDLVAAGIIEALPSYFMECLMYRVPNGLMGSTSSTPLTDDLTRAIVHIWGETRPGYAGQHWLEPNEIKPLFGGGQPWTMADANKLALQVFSLFDLGENS